MDIRDMQRTTGNRNSQCSIWPVALFTCCYMLAAVIGAFQGGNKEFLIYIGVMLVLIAVVWKVHTRVSLSRGALWGLSIWGLLHMAGGLLTVPFSWPVKGETHVLYNLWLVPGALKYDQVVHACGFGITTWVCWQGLRKALSGRGVPASPTLGLMVLVAAAGIGFGALNEVIEFIATLMVPETNVGGYRNTGFDLVANLIGAGVAALLIYRFDCGKNNQDG